ncbi:lipase B [Penicillium bovifimosum]|uniref:Lipase B n=1 Tax=Penicillium bovifimosum TaxID=126998 RepID=A0A9W9GH71_9EURO|nr:lipase B [Penicillium bovifimosum]KAJ5120438.1 lipase B [Penicillium bovifimosum]
MKAILVCAGLVSGVFGSPLTTSRQTSAVSNTTLLDRLSFGAEDGPEIGKDTAHAFDDLLSQLDQIQSIKTVDSATSALAAIENILSEDNLSLVDIATKITAAGLVPPDILSLLNGYLDSSINSHNNKNPASSTKIYPSKATEDAPYSVPEAKLRAAIQIPDGFSFGRNGRIPVILIPGTAVPAGTTYQFSFGKLGGSIPVDPVWVNIPRTSLSDVQVNSEYVAYAINYISAISAGTSLAIMSWSQGGLNVQWALKYWPSTRKVVQDFIAISPDMHGTVVEPLVCPALAPLICVPALWQQGWDSDFVRTLRADGGDSAYVPTTTVYSTFDEIVQPMFGPNASAILGDVRGVGVKNVHLQTECAGKPAGGFYTHEGVLYNPLAWAVAIDAITHDGPADLARVDMENVCLQVLPQELGLSDLLGTEGLVLIAVAEALIYQPHVLKEPPIKKYALIQS